MMNAMNLTSVMLTGMKPEKRDEGGDDVLRVRCDFSTFREEV